MVNWDYLDAIYGDKNIYSTPRDLLKFDNGRNSSQFLNPKLLKEAYIPYSNEYKGTKNYGLGIRMINWPNGRTFIITMAGGMATWRPVTLPEEK
jgi:hypothetical protein